MRHHLLTGSALLLASAAVAAQDAAPASARPWTLAEVRQRLAFTPADPYLQYVGMQLARRDGQLEEFADGLRSARRNAGRDRARRDVDVFSLFTGALAVQESLQLDALLPADAADMAKLVGQPEPWVEVNTLTGPTVVSHPWTEMLAGRKPEVSPLSLMVPADFYLVEFGQLTKMLEVLDTGDLWTTHLFAQADQSAQSQEISDRLRTQLAVVTTGRLRPFYDQVVAGVGITGSDLYLREGSDVTLLFELRRPPLFRAQMDGFLDRAAELPGAERSSGEWLGVGYEQVTTPDRAVHVFSAYPRPDLHVRSNSVVAFRRILAAIAGKDEVGAPVSRLGETDEYAYIRTLMPRGDELEDGLVYLSDPLIRRLVGPQVKLTERRRMQCYNTLRMIGHAALLHQTERGTLPTTLADLVEADCAPAAFGAGRFACPDAGTYALASDRLSGSCTHHGSARSLRPCVEIPVARVTADEASAYQEFLADYERYWRTFFDPIALRVQARPERYRVETLILPLIDNSIYSSMAQALGLGAPEPLDALPVPTRSIFSVAMRFDKRALLAEMGPVGYWMPFDAATELTEADVTQLLQTGLGNQVSLHACDTDPLFDFSLPQFLGQALGSFDGRSSFDMDETLWISFFVTALSAPVYVALPVENGEIVDAFLGKLDRTLATAARAPARGGWFREDLDFYVLPTAEGRRVRCASIALGPIKWRMFWARIDDAVYIASKKSLLRDLGGAQHPTDGPVGHAMLRVRAKHWAAVLDDYELGWAESNREACLHNLGPLSNIARAFGLTDGAAIAALATGAYGTWFFCPEQGRYTASADGSMSCSEHGTANAPRQPAKPNEDSALATAMRSLREMSATLTFLPEGLRAVLVLDRQ
ncbi:MAG: hypothetical protein AAF628_33215 [Planctomycetota bacterium]